MVFNTSLAVNDKLTVRGDISGVSLGYCSLIICESK